MESSNFLLCDFSGTFVKLDIFCLMSDSSLIFLCVSDLSDSYVLVSSEILHLYSTVYCSVRFGIFIFVLEQ